MISTLSKTGTMEQCTRSRVNTKFALPGPCYWNENTEWRVCWGCDMCPPIYGAKKTMNKDLKMPKCEYNPTTGVLSWNTPDIVGSQIRYHYVSSPQHRAQGKVCSTAKHTQLFEAMEKLSSYPILSHPILYFINTL